MNFHWMGDDKIEAYLAQWRHITSNLEEDIPEKAQQSCLETHMAQSEVLKEDLAHYNRYGTRGADHTYDFLLGSMERYIERQHRDRVIALRQTTLKAGALDQPLKTLPPAAPAVDVPVKNTRPRSRGPKSKTPRGPKTSAELAAAVPPTLVPTNKAPPLSASKAKPCWFHNAAKYINGAPCKNGAKCLRDHSHYVSRTAFEAMPVPKPRGRSASRGKSPGRGTKGNGKGGRGATTAPKTKEGGKARAPSRCPKISSQYCYTFYKTGKCDKKDCFPHLSKEVVDAQALSEGVSVPE